MFEDYFIPPVIEEDVEFLPILSVDDEAEHSKINVEEVLPILPLRNTVLFPGVVIPITVGRDKSIKAVKYANKKDKVIGVVSQKDYNIEEPDLSDLNTVGTAARMIKMLKMPDGSTTVIIQGIKKIRIDKYIQDEPFIEAAISVIPEEKLGKDRELLALVSSLKDMATRIIKISPNIPTEAGIVLKNIESAEFLVHFIASNLNIKIEEKQKILETEDIKERATLVLGFLTDELKMLELKDQIQSKVKTDIEKQQRDYFLNQQLKTIQEELGGSDALQKEIDRLKKKAKKKKWDAKVGDAFERELEKLQRINPAAAEYSLLLNYLDTLLDLPWKEFTKDNFNLDHAIKVLDKDHFGLDKAKDRILEYLAVLKLKGDLKSPILCFIGPPGVGKTSLGKSIARALNRKYVRMSLGGLHDEAEIRGHRKTYIGAMPGRIVQNLKKVHISNPVFILDEIDKVGSDFRGDPSSALLEVLDPEQNSTFYDNYLELEYDLSKVLFIATANSLSNIQSALRDRMEVIFLDGYSVEEKREIAKKHLVSKQRKAHGLKATDVRFQPTTLEHIILDYTRESGVRELDRQIASVMRSIAKKIATETEYNHTVKVSDLHEYLGYKKYDRNEYLENNPPGVAIGLAYTVTGGEILYIESSVSRGKGMLTLTGNLGDVMKESATTALTFIKSHADLLGIDEKVFENWNIHLHVPEGATPKDGPSAGVSMMTTLTSVFTQRRVKPFLAMTGEITLRGKVLPVGGIKEKVLAAKRAGMKMVVLPEKNKNDIEQINKDYLKGLKFHFVKDMLEVLDIALEKKKVENARDLTMKKE
jgi:ATP-dependent Lon protease